VSADNTKAMQEALNAAVKQLNNGSGAVRPPMPADPMGMLMTLLPRLLPGQDTDSEELGEKVEGVQKDVAGVRADVQVLRKQVHRVFKMQEQVLAELAELQKQQLAVSQAILDLAGQMARIEILEDPGDDEGRDARGGSAPSARPPRAGRSPRK
jgi:hypothetical protein